MKGLPVAIALSFIAFGARAIELNGVEINKASTANELKEKLGPGSCIDMKGFMGEGTTCIFNTTLVGKKVKASYEISPAGIVEIAITTIAPDMFAALKDGLSQKYGNPTCKEASITTSDRLKTTNEVCIWVDSEGTTMNLSKYVERSGKFTEGRLGIIS